jgi:aminopeptidase
VSDPRYHQLAEVLVRHSAAVRPGEHVLVEAVDIPRDMVLALVASIRRADAHPHVWLRDLRIQRALVAGAGVEQLGAWASNDSHQMEQMDVFFAIRNAANAFEHADISRTDARQFHEVYSTPVHRQRRVPKTRWCSLTWPSPSMAQLAQQSTESYEDFFFAACTLDYARMSNAAVPLHAAMMDADKIRIKGPGETDLSFSVRGVGAFSCTGSHNLPDGECFTSPLRFSANGVIQFNTPVLYQGTSMSNVRLVFAEGRVVEASCDQGESGLNAILDTDAGARFIGEFAIGFNPFVVAPTHNLMFDEKITGSLHLTLGEAYSQADNGNRSRVQWALVLIQRPEYGGGEIWFDDRLVRKDGRFLPEALLALNPDIIANVAD